MPGRYTIVGLGEALFDVFPDGEILGGAPLNVAMAAHQLAQRGDGNALAVSRVGQDTAGDQVIDTLTQRGLDASYIQSDPDNTTGKVYVTLNPQGQPDYEIVKRVAWDNLQYDPNLEQLAGHCEAVCFGSLAQRGAQTRNTIYRFLYDARHAIRLFDVNLRQDYFDRSIITRSCEHATVVKLNETELPIVADLLGIRSNDESPTRIRADLAARMLKQFDLTHVVVTRGEDGTAIFDGSQMFQDQPISYPPQLNDQNQPIADAVGAGDACCAALLLALVQRMPLDRAVTLANHAGAYVASRQGATPELPDSILDLAKT